MYINNYVYKQDVEAAAKAVPGIDGLYGKKILITGATGMIASFVIDLLMYLNMEKNARIQIAALGRDLIKLQCRYRSYLEHPYLDFIIQDIREPLGLSCRADYIIHAAGNGYPAAFRQDPVGTMTSVLSGTCHILEYAKRCRTDRVVYISSGEVYGQGREHMPAFDEDYSGYVDSMNPRSCYPSAKRAAETLCAAYLQQYHVDTVAVRPAHTFGPNTTAYDNRASAQFFRNVLHQEDIVLKSAGKQMRSYTYVADCVSGILTALLWGRPGEAYNIAHVTERITIREFASMTADAADRKCIYGTPDGLERAECSPIQYAVLDSSKLQGLGWKSVFSVRTGIEHTLAVLKEKEARQHERENDLIQNRPAQASAYRAGNAGRS